MLGMMAHTCTTTLGRLRQKGHEFEASLDYLGHLKITKKQWTENLLCGVGVM